jgi:aminomethyltransferase
LHGAPIDILRAHSPLVPRVELWADATIVTDISQALEKQGAAPVSASALEHLRLLEGTPLYGTDIRDRDLPQETGQTRALHFAKGCYLGQEIVERIRSRGSVHRALSGFILTGPIPPLPAPLFNPEAPEKILGELTSAAHIEPTTGAVTLGLGIVRREALERNTAIHCGNGTVTPVKLPYHSGSTGPEKESLGG